MSKIIEAIEAKQNELEQRKQDIKRALEDALSETKQNMRNVIREQQQQIEQNMTELRQTHAEELKRQAKSISSSYKRHLITLWIVLLLAIGGLYYLTWQQVQSSQTIDEMHIRQQWLWKVNEKAIESAYKKQQQQKK